jgi:methylase of polypeptide subunit release factors
LKWCVVECGYNQAQAVQQVFAAHGQMLQEKFQDSFGHERAIFFIQK